MSKSDEDRVIAVTKRGSKITQKIVDELAAEAEAGYDLSLGRRRGRPSLDQGVSPRVTFRITGELQSQARDRAEREGKSLSELARDALAEYVK
jgi:predicted HicB family RNase H-like nuclease